MRQFLYQTIRSKRKSISLRITEDGKIEIKVPYYYTDEQVKEMIEKKSDWITEKLQLVEQQKTQRENKMGVVLKDGAELPFYDHTITLKIRYYEWIDEARINYKNKTLHISLPKEDNELLVRCVAACYQSLGKAVFYCVANEYAQRMNVSFQKIAVKDQKTRWGSCSTKQNLNFNWRLLLLPKHLLEYVVVHELAHLIEMNHSKEFWNEVEKILPNYRECEKELKEYGLNQMIIESR